MSRKIYGENLIFFHLWVMSFEVVVILGVFKEDSYEGFVGGGGVGWVRKKKGRWVGGSGGVFTCHCC